MAFNREAAKAEGYTDEEIDAYLNPAPPVQQPPKDRSEENTGAAQAAVVGLGGGALDLAKEAIKYGVPAYGLYKGGQAIANRLPPTPTPTGPVGVPTTTYPTPAPTGKPAVNIPINQPIAPGTATTPPAPPAAPRVPPVGGPAAQQGASFIENITARFAPLAEKVAPVLARAAPALNMAGRIAGPAGLALGAYQGAQFAQQAELGKRLAAGEGRYAQQAFRQNNTQYGAPVTRDQAIAVLQSGSERDIYAFGGREKLQAIAGQ